MKGFSDVYTDEMSVPNSKDVFTAKTKELLADKHFDDVLKDMKYFNDEYMQKSKLNTAAETHRTAKQSVVNSEAHANGMDYSHEMSLPNSKDEFAARIKELKGNKAFDKELKNIKYFSEDYMQKPTVKSVSEKSMNEALDHVLQSNRTIDAIKKGYSEDGYREQMKHERDVTHAKANDLVRKAREAIAKAKKEKPESPAHKKANDAIKAAKAAKADAVRADKGLATLRDMEELQAQGKKVIGIEKLREAERNKALDSRSRIDEYTYNKELEPSLSKFNKVIEAARSLSESDKDFDTELHNLKDKDYDKRLSELKTGASKNPVIGSELLHITEDSAKISREAIRISDSVNKEASKSASKSKTDNVAKAVERTKKRNEEIRKSYGDESGSTAVNSNGQKLLIKAKVEEKPASDAERVRENTTKVEQALKTLEKPEGRRLRDLDLREEKQKVEVKAESKKRARVAGSATSSDPYRRPPIVMNSGDEYDHSTFYPPFAQLKNIINDAKTISNIPIYRPVIGPRLDVKPDSKNDIKPAGRHDVRPIIKPFIQPIVKPIVQPIVKPENKSDIRVIVGPIVKPDVKPDVKPYIPTISKVIPDVISDIKVIEGYRPRPKKPIQPYAPKGKQPVNDAAKRSEISFMKSQRLIRNSLMGLNDLI